MKTDFDTLITLERRLKDDVRLATQLQASRDGRRRDELEGTVISIDEADALVEVLRRSSGIAMMASRTWPDGSPILAPALNDENGMRAPYYVWAAVAAPFVTKPMETAPGYIVAFWQHVAEIARYMTQSERRRALIVTMLALMPTYEERYRVLEVLLHHDRLELDPAMCIPEPFAAATQVAKVKAVAGHAGAGTVSPDCPADVPEVSPHG